MGVLRPFKCSSVTQRLRIIAPLVTSTLYNVLWLDSHSGQCNQLCRYFMNCKFLASLYASKPRTFVFMPSNCHLSVPSKEACYAFRWVLWPHTLKREASFTLPSFAVTGSYICDSVLRRGIFLRCILLSTPPLKQLSHLVTDITHILILQSTQRHTYAYSCRTYYY